MPEEALGGIPLGFGIVDNLKVKALIVSRCKGRLPTNKAIRLHAIAINSNLQMLAIAYSSIAKVVFAKGGPPDLALETSEGSIENLSTTCSITVLYTVTLRTPLLPVPTLITFFVTMS